jgi:hypothetical protein
MLDNWHFITLYWLSGFAQEKFEIWKGRRDAVSPGPHAASFTLYLLVPLVEAEESHLTISDTENGLIFTVDWFPDEEFTLKAFATDNRKELMFMSEFMRETIFIHLT